MLTSLCISSCATRCHCVQLQAAPLRQDKLPARPRDQRQAAAAARAATATQAAGSRRRGKDHGSEVGLACCSVSSAC
jgi:hypothetical protein